jgi:malonate transporter and related proteins
MVKLKSFYCKIFHTQKMEIFFALGVLAVVVFFGWLARRLGIISLGNTVGMSSYIYYFALPALFFPKIAQMDLAALDAGIVWGSLLPVFALMLILLGLRVTKLLTKDNFILLALAIAFGSNAFFGITFFEALRGEAGLDFAVISSSILGPVGIFLTIYLFEYATNRGTGWCFCGKIIRNPLILSILAGVIFSLLQIRIGFLFEGIAMLGKTAGPIAIFALGTFIHDNFSLKSLKKALPFALFRLIILPLTAFGLLTFFLNIEAELQRLLILQSGIPAAISLAVFARKYNYRTAEISNLVVVTSLGSFLVLGIAYFFIS